MKCVDFRSDTALRQIATSRIDKKLMAILSRDIVAAEAHYHCSCYRSYVRDKTISDDKESDLTNDAYEHILQRTYDHLFLYFRNTLFTEPKVFEFDSLKTKLTNFMTDRGFEIVIVQIQSICIRIYRVSEGVM